MRRTRQRGLSRIQAGLLLVIAVVVLTYLGFTKAIPFRQHFEVKADFKTSNTLRVASLVRIAGVNVGKVQSIEPLEGGKGGVRVTMRIDKAGRPIHKDATVALRPRIFLEGNLFVDVHPGTPTSPILGDGEVIPARQTTTPVQLDQLLTALQSNTRADLQTLLVELSTGLGGRGGIGYNRSVQYWEPAFKNSAIVNDATLGIEQHDLSRYLSTSAEFAAALDRNPPALKALISDFNTTAAAFADERVALRDTLTELPRTLRAAQPALAALNSSFPPLRRLTADLRPAARSTGPMIDASLPFISQLRSLVAPTELQGFTNDLARLVPDLARLNDRLPSLYRQVRKASSCQNEVILPWSHQEVGDVVFKPKGKVFQEAPKGLPGVAGESRAGDAGGQWVRVLAGNGVFTYALTVGGVPRFGLTNFPLLGANPPKMVQPEIRYDVPCETQETANIDARPQEPPPLLRDTPVPLPPIMLRLGQAMSMESVAFMLLEKGQTRRAEELLNKATALRRRHGVEDKTVKMVNGRAKVVDADDKTKGERGVEGQDQGARRNQSGKDGKGGKGDKDTELAEELLRRLNAEEFLKP